MAATRPDREIAEAWIEGGDEIENMNARFFCSRVFAREMGWAHRLRVSRCAISSRARWAARMRPTRAETLFWEMSRRRISAAGQRGGGLGGEKLQRDSESSLPTLQSIARNMSAAVQAGALAGVRVVDMSRLLPGPLATQFLADLGAEVIKVEDMDGGARNTRHMSLCV